MKKDAESRAVLNKISTLKNLPTLPHILVKLFSACNRPSVDLQEVAEIAGTDPSLSTKLLKLVNSAYFGLPQKIQNIDKAVTLLGISGVKNLAVCACIHEAFATPKNGESFNLKGFWWHSFRCAHLAKNIAVNMKFDQPDEAFIAGLLHDVGKIVLWVNFKEAYEDIHQKYHNRGDRLAAEGSNLGITHDEVAAWLLDRWNFAAIVSDSVRYHHEHSSRIAQALPLAQIVCVADRLCNEATDDQQEGLTLAEELLKIGEQQCGELLSASDEEAREIAVSLNINVGLSESESESDNEEDHNIKETLNREVLDLSLVMGTLEGFLTAKDRKDILSIIADSLNILFDVNHLLFFWHEAEKGILYGYRKNDHGRFCIDHSLAVSMRMNQSLIVKAIKDDAPLNSYGVADQEPLTIADEQIIRLLGGDGIYCLPMSTFGEPLGALVLSVKENDLHHLQSNEKLLKILVHKGSMALRVDDLRQRQLRDIQAKRLDATSDLARRVVHEVNNPLSIVKNYLKILELKMSDAQIVQDEVSIINEEINRVAVLLRKLTNFSTESGRTQERVDVNALLMDIVKLTKDSMLSHFNVTLLTDLDASLPKIDAEKAGLKQVFLNLIKNAAEAMSTGGTLSIHTHYVPPPIDCQRPKMEKEANGYAEIRFIDDGPGIPSQLKEKLFDPYVSSKGKGHSGLGLSIVYNIVKSFQGNITFESGPEKGTVFKIELPVNRTEKRIVQEDTSVAFA